MSYARLFALLGCAVLVGCGDDTSSNKCSGVMCPMGQSCNSLTGQCVAGGDGGGGGDLSMNMGDGGGTDDAMMMTSDCTNATALTFNNGMATASSDNTNYTDTTRSPNCGGSGPDQTYTFTITQKQLVDVALTPKDQNLDAVVYLRTACADDTSELACDEQGAGSPVGFQEVLQPGTYFLFVDGFQGTTGGYDLTVSLSAPPVITNDTCASATALTFTNGDAMVNGDVRGAADDAAGTCGGKGGSDGVFTFTTTQPQKVTVTVTPDQANASWLPAVYLRKTCDMAATEVGCAIGGMVVGYLPAGTYFLWLDGANGGKFALDVKLDAPGPVDDSCSGTPTALTFTSGMATAAVDTSTYVSDGASPTCGGSGNDVIYSFTTTQAQKVTATLTPDTMQSAWEPVVSIRTACEDATTEQACNDSGSAGAAAKAVSYNLPAGTYYVWADGYNGTMGKGTLTVALDTAVPPPPNDACAGALPIKVGDMLMGDTGPAINNLGGMLSVDCDVNSTGNFPGRDVVYAFTAAATGNVTITLASDNTWDPALWISPGTCTADGSTCKQASDNVGNDMPETITLAATMGTTYYLVVDSYDPSVYGPFTLSIK